jgi:hypothetical protein
MSVLACGELVDLLGDGTFIPVVAIIGGCAVGTAAIIGGAASSIVKSRAREHTKRELAAYVAEGLIDPDKAVSMMNAGTLRWEKPDGGCC